MNSPPLRADRFSFAELHTVEKIVELATDLDWLGVDYHTPTNQEQMKWFIQALAPLLPDHGITNTISSTTASHLTIKRLISIADIEASLPELIHSMVLFRSIANVLMGALAQQLDTTVTTLTREFHFQYQPSGKLQNEILGEQWCYYFHGMDCDFVSSCRQRVCVALSNRGFAGTDFVVFRPYEFLEFVKSTRELAPLLRLLRASEANTDRAFEVLEKNGILQRADRDIQKDSKEWQLMAAFLR